MIDAEKQAAVGRLVAGILHEMNTPLGAIRSSTDTMGKALERCGDFVSQHADEDDPDAKRALRAATSASKLRVGRRFRSPAPHVCNRWTGAVRELGRVG